MKRRILIFSILIVLLIFLLTLIGRAPKSLYHCAVDSDCIKVVKSCCGCGEATINKAYKNYWEEKLSSRCARVDCTADLNLDDLDLACLAPPKCAKNRCVLDLEEGKKILKKRFSFPTELMISPGQRMVLPLGVRNTENSTISFNINIERYNQTSGIFDSLTSGIRNGSFLWDNATHTLYPGDAGVYSIFYIAEHLSGEFQYKIRILKNDTSEYTATDFFVTVR